MQKESEENTVTGNSITWEEMGEKDNVVFDTSKAKTDKMVSESHDAKPTNVFIKENEEHKFGEWIEIKVVSSEELKVVDKVVKQAIERGGMVKEQPSKRKLRRSRGQKIQKSESDKSILELQLITKSSTDGSSVDAKSMNAHNDTSNAMIVWGIQLIVPNPSAVRGGLSSSSPKPERQSPRTPIKVINVLLMVFVMAATFLLAASCNPPNAFQQQNQGKNATVSIWDMVTAPSHFQVFFYYMICSMVGFIVSMGTILVLLWPLPYRKITTFVLAVLMAVYILLLDINTPKFSVTIGYSRIPSGIFMGMCAVIFISCGFTALILVKVYGRVYHGISEEVALGGVVVM